MSSLLKHRSTHPVQGEKGKERNTTTTGRDANTEKGKNIDTGNKLQQQRQHGYKGFFKRHFSLNLKHKNTSTPNGNSTAHSPRIMSPSPRVSMSMSLPISPPGPASPTVQHTDHIPTPLKEKLYLDKGRDNKDSNKGQTTSKNKKSTTPTTSSSATATTQNKTISSSSSSSTTNKPLSQSIDSSSSSSSSSNTISKDITSKEEGQKENTINNKITKTQSHTLQYEYFPIVSESKPVSRSGVRYVTGDRRNY